MATNFLEYSGGSNGWLTSPVAFLTTELSVASGIAATSSVAGPWTQSSIGSGQICLAYFTWTTTFTPSLAGGNIAFWWLNSPDGTNFETTIATASTTVPALGRSPDFIIPCYENGTAFGTPTNAIKWCAAPFIYPWMKTKLLFQNNTGTTLPSGCQVLIGSVANQY